MSSATLRFLQHENARLKEENEALQEELLALQMYMTAVEELFWATQRIVSEENLFSLLDKIIDSAMAILRAEDGSLLLRDEQTDELVFVLVHSDIQNKLRGYRIPGDKGIAGWVANNREPLIVNNPRQDWRFYQQVDLEFNFHSRSIICVPLVTKGKLIGVLELLNKRNNEDFVDPDATLLMIFAQVAATALDEMRSRIEREEASAAPA